MTWKAVMEEPLPAIPEGECRATVDGVHAVDAQYGPAVRIDFTVVDEDNEARRVSGIASQKLSETSKFGRWVAGILGRVPDVGEQIAAQDLLCRECRIVVQHKTNAEGQTFANVVKVLAVDGQ